MTKVSRRVLDKDLENYLFELFIHTVISLKNPEDVLHFLKDLLSPTERIMLVKRLAIAILLTKGYTYDHIDATLKVSRPTIMNVSLYLKHGSSGYAKVVEGLLRGQRKEELVDKIEEILLQLSLPKRYGSIAFKKKQEQGRELYRRKRRRNML